MNFNEQLNAYAELLIKTGLSLQKDRTWSSEAPLREGIWSLPAPKQPMLKALPTCA